MPSYFRQGACSLAVVSLFSGLAGAQTLAGSARQLEPGSWQVTPYYQGADNMDLRFRVNSSGPCAGGGGTNPAFPCGGVSDVTGKADLSNAVVKVLVQPWDRMQYYVFGGAGTLSLSLPNGNVLTSERLGHLVGAGVKAQLMPDTVVSPAIALDASFGWHRYRFTEVSPAAAPAIDQRLDIYQYQVAVIASHRFELGQKASVEPYGGLKWLRSHSWLKDQRNAGGGSRIGGIQDTFSPFVGLQAPVFEHETIFAEASFVDGVHYAAGMQVRF